MFGKVSLILLILAGCSHKKPQPTETILYAIPECTKLKEPCPIINNKMNGCKFVLTCTQIGKK